MVVLLTGFSYGITPSGAHGHLKVQRQPAASKLVRRAHQVRDPPGRKGIDDPVHRPRAAPDSPAVASLRDDAPGCTSTARRGSALAVDASSEGTDADDATPAHIGNPAATKTTTASAPHHPAQPRMDTPCPGTPTA